MSRQSVRHARSELQTIPATRWSRRRRSPSDSDRVVVALRPMAGAEIPEYLAASRDGYIADRVDSGDDAAVAARAADETIAAVFPGGEPGPGHFRVEEDGEPVGSLWIGPTDRSTNTHPTATDDNESRTNALGTAVTLPATRPDPRRPHQRIAPHRLNTSRQPNITLTPLTAHGNTWRPNPGRHLPSAQPRLASSSSNRRPDPFQRCASAPTHKYAGEWMRTNRTFCDLSARGPT